MSNHSGQTIVNYLRSVKYLCKHTGKHPRDTEIDEIIDYLYQLQYHKFRAWRTIKIYVAGLRWYYSHIYPLLFSARKCWQEYIRHYRKR
ncbi:MAG: phage integrase N-terminal SAM-like domain-containing protein [Bacteroidales bacterium]|nr:phage integrase N-terminal SAM-like domain-containing protein [Bacteroidales bacterium]